MFTIPNILTLARIAMIPLIWLLFLLENSWGSSAAWICLGVYTICAITDFLDGYLARKLNQISAFGTFLDPISDKIFVGCVLLLLITFDRIGGIWIIPVFIIFTREFLISGLREFLGPKNVKMPVTQLAKWKTTAQMLSLGFLIVGPHAEYAQISGLILLSVAALLTAITGLQYMKAGWTHLK